MKKNTEKQSKNKPGQCSFKKSKFNVFKSLDCKNVRNGKFWVCGKKIKSFENRGPRLRKKNQISREKKCMEWLCIPNLTYNEYLR